MRNLKKVVALIAAFAMIMSTAVFAKSFPDVANDSVAAEAIDVLSDIGIIEGDENGNFNPDAIVTRAEMATLIARIQGYEGDIAQAATNFADVPAGHWASGYIAMAAGQGIVNGYGDGNFGPDDSVKYEEAIKMVMVTLGYEPMAQEQGGYPAGYIAAANSQRVLSGVVGGVQGQGCPRSTIALLLYNAIDTALMIRTGYGSEASYVVTGTYSDYDRLTLMGEYLDISKLKGFVIANEYTSFKDASKQVDTSTEPEVEITVNGNYENTGSDKYGDISSRYPEDMFFRVGNSNAGSFLGKSVIFYVREDSYSDDDVIVSIVEDTSRTNEVSFTLDQYEGYEDGYIEYMRNPTDRTPARLRVQNSGDVYVVYNGVSVSGGMSALSSYLSPSNGNYVQEESTVGGKITAIDTDSTTGYNVIMIEIAATAVVDEIQGARLTFKGNVGDARKYNNRVQYINFGTQDTDFVCNITKDGEPIEYTDLQEWDVLSIITNNDLDNVYNVRVVSNQIDGRVSATTPSETSYGGLAYRIDGTDYDAAEGAYLNGNLRAGAAGMFYIDEYGKIAAYDRNGGTQASSIAADNYGYVLRAVPGEDEFGTETVMARILSNKKGVVQLNMASTVKVTKGGNDTNYKMDGSTQYDAEALASAIENKLVRFGVNSANEVNNIEMAVRSSSSTSTADFTFMGASTDAYYDESSQSIRVGSRYDVDETTIVFYISNGDSNGLSLRATNEGMEVTSGLADADYSSIATGADLAEIEGFAAAVYDEDDTTGVARVVVVYNMDGMISPAASMAVIDSVSESIDDESNDVYVVKYYQDGELLSATTTNEVYDDSNNMLADAKRGDIFKFSYDENGDISAAQAKVMFSNRNDNLRAKIPNGTSNSSVFPYVPTVTTGNVTDMSDTTTGEKYVFGAVVAYRTSNNSVTLRNLESDDEETYSLRNADVYVYDPTRKASARLDVGSPSYFSFDDDLVGDGETGKVYNSTNTSSNNLLSDSLPAYGLLGFAAIRIYDGDVEEALYIAPYEYDNYYVDTEESVPATKVELTGGATEVKEGEEITFNVVVTPSYSTDRVTVKSSNADVATATLNSAGTIVTVKGVKADATPVTITVSAGDVEGTASVTVVAAE